MIIYKTEEMEENNHLNTMAIDLGLDNLATLTFKDNSESYIINGKTLKSKNAYFNREIARLSSVRMKQVGSDKFKNTKQIKRLRLKRRNYIKDYLHKASKIIIDLAIKHKVSTIVIGDIKIVLINESYTSGCSAIDLEELNKSNLEGMAI
ncbi:transposase [Sporosalibacterium faouarense]|uniref:transposase n=1 Tax=Sporosalibacterium faouarense TaxID=516123 RepID=UPI00192ABB67|nr:transposase [Sporosalibacterium faouarense]